MELLDLPNEMIEYVASFLPAESLSALSQTCRKLWEITKIDTIWQVLCEQDYQVTTNKGWNLSYQEIYCKVLQKYGFLGLKRLALLPHGGLVNVCWAEGEIQVHQYRTQDRPVHSPISGSNLIRELVYVMRWNESLDEMSILCMQSPLGPKPAVLVQAGNYPWIRCEAEKCFKSHKRKENAWGQTNKNFTPGFLDHPDAFDQEGLKKGFNCPMLPVPVPSPADRARSPIELGFYVGNYGLHGDEILSLGIRNDNPDVLEGLKIIGDPNVPAGYASITIFLNKPIAPSEAEQESILHLLEADEERTEESFEALRNSSNNNPNMQQPFAIPGDCFGRGQDAPNTCQGRYLGFGRIAGHFYTDPSTCHCHLIKFSNVSFGILWLDLSSFSLFKKVEEDFSLCKSSIA